MDGTLERSEELCRIVSALEAASAGGGCVLVVEGQAGIGKTHLVRYARSLAKERGFGRLQATGDELEATISWGVVRQMVDRSISRYRGKVREKIIAGPTGNALAVLAGAPTGHDAGDAEVARTLHALWWVAVDLSSFRPLLITVDDAQWSDLPSMRFLTYLARRVSDLPIVLLVATRPPSHQSGPLAELTVSRHVQRILPRALTRDAIAALGAQRGPVPSERVVDAVHSASAGNPFLAGALLDELAALGHQVDAPETAQLVTGLGPSAVSRTMLGRLTSEALRLAAATAVLGSRCDPWLAGSLAGLDPAAVDPAIEVLAGANVVAASPEGLDFLHPVVREATLSALGPIERAALHAKAARRLHAERVSVDRVAAHLVNAPVGTLEEATEIFRQAAALSLAAGDAHTAAAYLTRAFDGDRGDWRLRADLGEALLRAGDPGAGRAHLRAAAAAADDRLRRAELLAASARATSIMDGPHAAIAELTMTLDGWPGVDLTSDFTPDRLVLEARLGIIRSFLPAERTKASAHLRQFAGLPGRTSDERTLLALLAQSGRYEVIPHTTVASIAGRALGHGELFRDAAGSVDTLVGWVLALMSLICADGVDLAREEVGRAQRMVRGHGSPLEFGVVGNAADFLAWRCGDVAAAEAGSEAILAAVAPDELTPQVIAVRATASMIGIYTALERGDLAGACAFRDSFVAQYDEGVPSVIAALWLYEACARIALAQDNPSEALTLAFRLRDQMAAADLDFPAVPWRSPAALAMLRLGDVGEARRLAAAQLDLTRRWGAATDLGAALRLSARVGASCDRLDTLTEAVAVLEGSAARLELARALVDLGETFRVVGRRSDARETLIRGGELAAACGSLVLRCRAGAALETLGDRPRGQFSAGQDSLTASERRIAGLAISGRSNRDIAHELFVSPKTVENHLGRVYMKLGITGRRELARVLT